MDSRQVLKWHMRVFKVCGLWSPKGGSFLYRIWMIFYMIMVNIAFPLSQLICVVYVDSVNAAVDHLVITSTVTMAVIKAINVLAKKKTLIKLLRVMKQLDGTVSNEEHDQIFKSIFRDSNRLFMLFCLNYVGSWTCVAIQVIMSEPKFRLYGSTYLYPNNEFLHRNDIYLGGIIFQATANLFMVFVDIAVDTYGSSLLQVLGGHVDVLSQRLQALGNGCTRNDNYCQQTKTLVELCEKYLLIIEYSKLLEEILSFALLSQFGVSGLVLCTCAYQLSVVNPLDDISKFLFCVVYSFAMITEIFAPSYSGSVVLVKSDNLSYDIFKSNWIPAPNKYKRALNILIERTLRPITIFAAGIFMLNLGTLLKILKTAYSLFALLQKVQK